MALTPHLKSLQEMLDGLDLGERTSDQNELLKELGTVDKAVDFEALRKIIEEGGIASTRMTRPGSPNCHCCGQPLPR